MTVRRRRPIDIFNISFLDVVSCGFGAIILLLVIVKVAEPLVIENSFKGISERIEQLDAEGQAMAEQARQAEQQLQEALGRLSATQQGAAELQQALAQLGNAQEAASLDLKAQRTIEGKLKSAVQRLTAEQKRLLGESYRRPAKDAVVGGVPVDSEYIIFIVDTSGSMQRHAWTQVRRKVKEVLNIYPRVKGIQVMNDMGEYMFSQYRGRWITDTKARRQAILKRLAEWAPFSNSSPVEGIESAITQFYAPDKKISLYIFGDDFSRGSIERVVNTVNRLNRRSGSGRSRVRIHAVGFPVILQYSPNQTSGVRFAALMRKLAESNNGSFVGLNDSGP